MRDSVKLAGPKAPDTHEDAPLQAPLKRLGTDKEATPPLLNLREEGLQSAREGTQSPLIRRKLDAPSTHKRDRHSVEVSLVHPCRALLAARLRMPSLQKTIGRQTELPCQRILVATGFEFEMCSPEPRCGSGKRMSKPSSSQFFGRFCAQCTLERPPAKFATSSTQAWRLAWWPKNAFPASSSTARADGSPVFFCAQIWWHLVDFFVDFADAAFKLLDNQNE